ncbi:MAG TPA: hypothetical protein PLP17_00685 [Oligoflexia bacterium]|nr:hypothetical protein [Oligoflexia bacterium]
MNPTITSILINDPMLMLEFCSVLLTLAYVTKLVFASSQHAQAPSLCLSLRGAKMHKETENHFWSWFSVGNLISTPKRSLIGQRMR